MWMDTSCCSIVPFRLICRAKVVIGLDKSRGRVSREILASVPFTDRGSNVNFLFLTGLGDSNDVWDDILARLTPSHVDVLSLADLMTGETFGLGGANETIQARLGDRSASTHLIGHSAGSMVAMSYAATHPVSSLYLSAPNLQPPRALMALQNVVFKIMPQSTFAKLGLTKTQLLSAISELQDPSIARLAGTIEAPTTVACGSKDRVNLNAGRRVAEIIPGADFALIPDASHEWPRKMPGEFAASVSQHLNRSETASDQS